MPSEGLRSAAHRSVPAPATVARSGARPSEVCAAPPTVARSGARPSEACSAPPTEASALLPPERTLDPGQPRVGTGTADREGARYMPSEGLRSAAHRSGPAPATVARSGARPSQVGAAPPTEASAPLPRERTLDPGQPRIGTRTADREGARYMPSEGLRSEAHRSAPTPATVARSGARPS